MKKRPSTNARLDEKVYLSMGGLCLLSVVVLAFRFATHHPCTPVKIRITSTSFTQGTPIRLVAETQKGQSFEWNFGDNATKTEYAAATTHTFLTSGRYTVAVTVDGECTDMQDIVIKDAPIIANPVSMVTILARDTALINQPFIVEDNTPDANRWEWRFEEGGPVEANGKKASHIYTTAGIKKVFLQINGRPDLNATRYIVVIDPNEQKNAARQQKQDKKPQATVIVLPAQPSTPTITQQQEQPAKVEEKPKAPEVSEAQMQAMLRGINESDRTVEQFQPYVCGNYSIPVVYNGKRMTLVQMCSELRSIKKGKIKDLNVVMTRNEMNCIVTMTVTVEKKKGFLGL